MKKIQAILFDMDGVLIDSEEFICQAAITFFKHHGITVSPKDFLPFVGAGENRYLGGVAEAYGMHIEDIEAAKLETYHYYDQLVSGKLGALPGVLDFIEKCKAAGLLLAVATSADKTKMEINLREMGIPSSTFHALVNGKDVEHKKPAPDIYLAAAKALGVSIEGCLVFEDAVNGVQAARAAGAKCVAITSSFTKEQLSAEGADRVIQGFSDIQNLSELDSLFQDIE